MRNREAWALKPVKIKFTRDHLGHRAGNTSNVSPATAIDLIKTGHAVPILGYREKATAKDFEVRTK